MHIKKYLSKIINRFRLIGKLKHLYRIRQARKILKKLKQIEKTEYYQGKIINYLRKVNPFVFEELVLTAIENSNLSIIRNVRYTGDGGIDGVFKTRHGKILIQCKRYNSYINNKHVEQFSYLVNSQNYKIGIFVHTGKTGDKAKNTVKISNNVVFISGSLLIDILLNKKHIEDYLSYHLRKTV